MAQLVVRDIENEVKHRLQLRAKRSGRSMEDMVRDILRDAAKEGTALGGGLGTEIANRFGPTGLKAGIPELRGYKIKPASFR